MYIKWKAPGHSSIEEPYFWHHYTCYWPITTLTHAHLQPLASEMMKGLLLQIMKCRYLVDKVRQLLLWILLPWCFRTKTGSWSGHSVCMRQYIKANVIKVKSVNLLVEIQIWNLYRNSVYKVTNLTVMCMWIVLQCYAEAPIGVSIA